MHDLGTTGLVNNIEIDNSRGKRKHMIVEIKENILRKWEVLKEDNMAERSVLPKVKADKKSKKIIE